MSYDAVVVGAGPNGLAAAIELARRGRKVLLREASDVVGGGARTETLTLEGFLHDTCSAVHPMAVASPFLRSLDLTGRGLRWIVPPAAVAHPLEGGRAAVLAGGVEDTARTLGADADAYRRSFGPFVSSFGRLMEDTLAPPVRVPRHPLLRARFGIGALRSATGFAERFQTEEARALFAGCAAHSSLRLDDAASAGVGLVLGLAGHAVGWPVPEGGAGEIGKALASVARDLGVTIATGAPVDALGQLEPVPAVLLDLTARQVARVAARQLPPAYRRKLERFDYGPAVFKLDWALSAPIPWEAEACASTATVHVGGTLEEIAASEEAVWEGRVSEHPFVILAQPSLFDASRAPPGKHTAWAYCHVPLRYPGDVTTRIEAQIERFAPGFRDAILDRHVLSPLDLEERNPNLVGGDIAGGTMSLRQILARPRPLRPYRTPRKGLYICSASTPPGGGVHGMCGFHAARAAAKPGA